MQTNHVQRSLLSRPGLATRFVFAFAVVFALANASMAYTLVFRDGHRVEVSPVFTLTTTTLTYEAAPGINRTVQLILVDVAATERANNDLPGSFSKHADRNTLAPTPPSAPHAQRTLTNGDLEPIRQRRIESEQNYEKHRIELGLPSIAETRRRQAQEEEATLDLARRRAADAANDEAYWRSRTASLRNEIVTVDAEINYLRASLGPSRQVPWITQGFISAGFAVPPFAGGFHGSQPGAGRLGAQARAGSQGLTNLGVLPLRPQRIPGGFDSPQRGFGSAFPIAPYGYADNSYDLGIRLNDLLTRRAGLEALWRELENEARIAKAPQVWLAPW
jgi:hypothetical protein